ncbi:MAG: response regulator [Cyanobacteriota bacterium]
MNKKKILIIDDEAQIRKILKISLESVEYTVIESETGNDGIAKTAMYNPDAVLLDLGLPDKSGETVLKELREWYKKPIFILSVKNSEKDIISCLDHGANDYLSKPFNIPELLARLRVIFRYEQNNQEEEHIFKLKDIEVDFTTRNVKKNGEIIKLTSTEYSLLSLLIKNRGKVLTHKYILNEVWGHGFSNETQYLRVYIGQLRKKFETDHNRPEIILTESGVGYRFFTDF